MTLPAGIRPLSPKRVAVLLGGVSAERDVSLRSGAMIADALRERGHQVTEYDTSDLTFIDELARHKPDIVYIGLHGRFGEDGTVQGLLEILGIPYVGSGVLASALAMAKVQAKQRYEQVGIPTPPYVVLTRRVDSADLAATAKRVQESLGTSVVVKPALEGSSLGLSIVHAEGELVPAIETAFSYDETVVVEKFVSGVEVTIGVIGNDSPEALPTIEVVANAGAFYDYESKYAPGGSEHIIPARVGEAMNARCSALAVEAHLALGCRTISRTDIIVDSDGNAWVLETNTLPGMTATSLVPDMARARGVEYPELCEWLISLGLEDAERRR